MIRRDATEPAILRTLGQLRADYIRLDPFDLLVLHRDQLFMLDCKTPTGRLTDTQKRLVARGWPLRFVVTPADVLHALGIHE